MTQFQTFVQGDRDALEEENKRLRAALINAAETADHWSAASRLRDLLNVLEINLIQEKYGLSVMFDQKKLNWEVRDPQGHFVLYGPTPAAAIFLWNREREKAEG